MATDCGVTMVEFRYEPLTYLLQNGLPELAMECWEQHVEGNDFYRQDQFGPDWGNYQYQEDEKELGFVAMREGDKLIGYATIKINRDIHQADLRIAVLLDVYITKDKRGYAVKFFRYVEEFVQKMGAYRLDVSQPLTSPQNVGKFYEFMGMRPMEMIWSKVLGTEGNA